MRILIVEDSLLVRQARGARFVGFPHAIFKAVTDSFDAHRSATARGIAL